MKITQSTFVVLFFLVVAVWVLRAGVLHEMFPAPSTPAPDGGETDAASLIPDIPILTNPWEGATTVEEYLHLKYGA